MRPETLWYIKLVAQYKDGTSLTICLHSHRGMIRRSCAPSLGQDHREWRYVDITHSFASSSWQSNDSLHKPYLYFLFVFFFFLQTLIHAARSYKLPFLLGGISKCSGVVLMDAGEASQAGAGRLGRYQIPSRHDPARFHISPVLNDRNGSGVNQPERCDIFV